MASTLQVDGAITSSAGATITTADNNAQLTLVSTDADASSGPQMTLYRNSSSPADNDFIGRIKMIGRNDNSQDFVGVDMIGRIIDASDGTEDSEFRLTTIRNGTESTDFKITPTEVVFNEDSADLDFRVESNAHANMLLVDGGNDIVSIVGGGSYDVGSFKNTLQIEGTTGQTSSMSITRNTAGTSPPYLQFAKTRGSSVGSNTVVQDGDDLGIITWNGADGTDRNTNAAMIKCEVDGTPGGNDMPGRLVFRTTADGASSTTERMRINSSGSLTVGQTSQAYGTVGASITPTGQLGATANGDSSLILNRTSSNGTIAQFRKDNSIIGRIGTNNDFGLGKGDTGIYFSDSGDAIIPCNADNSFANRDNAIDLGYSSVRFQTLYATTSSINTSDKNEKQDIEELSDAEKRVAVVAKGLLRKYRWKDAVAKKGDNARIHFGIMAQDLQDAFTAESLDASKYGMFCSNTWWEKEITVDAVEAKDAVYEEVTDSDGNKTNNLVSHAVEAKDAYTYRDTKQEATEGYTEKTRLGVRYSELLAFIISAI